MANNNVKAKRFKLRKHIANLPRQMNKDTVGHFETWEGSKMPDRFKAERVKAGGGLNREVMSTLKRGTLTLGIPMGEINELVLRLYGRLFIGTPEGRMEVERTIRHLRKQKAENLFFHMRDNAYERVRMYYRADRTQFIIVRDDKRRLVTQISIPYPDKNYALQCWTLERVRWVQKTSSVAPPEA